MAIPIIIGNKRGRKNVKCSEIETPSENAGVDEAASCTPIKYDTRVLGKGLPDARALSQDHFALTEYKSVEDLAIMIQASTDMNHCAMTKSCEH